MKFEIEKIVKAGRRNPTLSVVQVGDDPASKTYIKNKIKACQYTGTYLCGATETTGYWYTVVNYKINYSFKVKCGN